MKASELRIGNLIYRAGHLAEVGFETLKLCTQRNAQFNRDFSAIPLTEDWMERFGFEEGRLPINDDASFIVQQGGTLSLAMEDDIFYLRHIESVHQLQNLFHALTGKELTINSNT